MFALLMCKNGDPKYKNSDAKCKNSDTGNSAIPKKELWSASFKWKGESSYLNMKQKKMYAEVAKICIKTSCDIIKRRKLILVLLLYLKWEK